MRRSARLIPLLGAGVFAVYLLALGSLAWAIGDAARRGHQQQGKRLKEQAKERAILTDPYGQSKGVGRETPTVRDTNRIDIVFDPARSEEATPCDRIELVQVIQMFADGNPIDPGTYFSGFAYRDATAINDDPATGENEDGTYVDHVAGETQPGYNAPGQGGSDSGSKNGASDTSTFNDSPQTGGGDRGFKNAGNPGGWTTVRYEFEVCAFCAKGHDCPDFFECITWVYEKSADDHSAKPRRPGISRITGQAADPSAKFMSAFRQFNTVKGYVPCSGC